MASVEELTELLSDMTFPATKEDIIEHAKLQGESNNILIDIRTLPEREYGDIMEVWQQLGAVKY